MGSLAAACAAVWALTTTSGLRPPSEARGAEEVDRPASASSAGGATPGDVELRLRIEWGDDATPRPFQGTIEVVGGTVAEPAPLGVALDEPGSMYVEGGRLTIEARSPRRYDGVDLTVRGPHGAKLLIQLSAGTFDASGKFVEFVPTPPAEIEPAASIGPAVKRFDAPGRKLSVRRAPGDRLRVRTTRDSLVFSTGDAFDLDLQPHLLGVERGAALRLSATLTAAARRKTVWTESIDVVAPADDSAWSAIPLSLRMPDVEGVYDLAFDVSRPSPAARLGLPAAALERRKVQLVVVAPQPPARTSLREASEPALLAEIDPTAPGWWERMRLGTAATLGRGPQASVRATIRPHATGRFVELPPSPHPDDFAWQTYPLSAAKPGAPHFLEIEYPADVAQSLGVGLIEPDAAGVATAIALDSGLFVDEADAAGPPRRLTRRLAVWPRTASPLLLLINRRHDAPAVYGKLRWLGPRGPSPAQMAHLPWARRDGDELPHAHLPDARADGRLAAAYFDRPSFAEAFGVGGVLDDFDPTSRRTLRDWTTFYDGARRMVDYLLHAGYGGAIVAVAADGGAIYPSRRLDSTPRYDDGPLFASGQDPLRKDVVELLMRLFDREGLRLIPAVEFTAPSPNLEATARRPDGAGIRVANGASSPSPADGEAGPRYNPLDPRVADEMSAVVEELVDRYGRHAAFGGVAVRLTPRGFAQLPSVEAGFDAAVVRRFARESKLALPDDPADAAAAVLSEHRAVWIQWRIEKIARTFERLQQAVAASEPSRRLYLLESHCWDDAEVRRRLRPSLPPVAAPEQVLYEMGLSPARLTARPGIVWVRGYASAPSDDLPAHGPQLEIDGSEVLDRFAAEQPQPAALIVHEPQPARLPSFDRASPIQPSQIHLLGQGSPGGVAARRRLVHQLAALDATAVFEGGPASPPADVEQLRRISGVIRALPAERFTTIETADKHVVVRTLRRGDRTYLYVVNDSAWPTSVALDVAASDDVVWRPFHGDARPAWKPSASGGRWQVELEPYDVVGGALIARQATISNPQVAVAPEIVAALQTRVRRLWTAAADLQRKPAAQSPRNGGFELAGLPTAPVPDWHVADGTAARIETGGSRGGERHLRLESFAGPAIVTGPPLTVARSGRMSLSVWLRFPEADKPAVRLALVGRLDGRDYYRCADVDRESTAAMQPAEWRQFVFPVHDLPTRGLGDLRVRVETTGAGATCLDDVAVDPLDFTEAERLELSKIITLAEYKLERRELTECAKLLDGYWPWLLLSCAPRDGGAMQTAAAAASPRVASPPPVVPVNSSMRERLRRYLPDFLR